MSPLFLKMGIRVLLCHSSGIRSVSRTFLSTSSRQSSPTPSSTSHTSTGMLSGPTAFSFLHLLQCSFHLLPLNATCTSLSGSTMCLYPCFVLCIHELFKVRHPPFLYFFSIRQYLSIITLNLLYLVYTFELPCSSVSQFS